MPNKKEYFTKFPNKYIQENIKTAYGVSRKFYITYILIDRYRSYEDYSWITIRKVMDFYGYKTTKHKPKAFSEILDVLEYMINNKMIIVKQDLDSLGYNTGVEIEIIPENFDAVDKFCMITSGQLDTIMMSESSLNKESILMAFLYINSYIGCRKPESIHPEQSPLAFWKSIDNMAKDLSMSKDTITQCMNFLTSSDENRKPLLVKREVGSVTVKNKPQNVPNIYVLNKEGYEQEIEWALEKMLEVYGVEEFDSVKGNYKTEK